MDNIPGYVRPGGKAYVSPEGMIYGTDGTLRWVHEFDQRKHPTVLISMLGKCVTLCAVIGILILLLQASTDGAALLSGLPVALALVAAGVVFSVVAFGIHLLQNGPFACVVFAMDEEVLSCQQIKGKTDKEQVNHAFAVWVGGQSQPAVRTCGFRQIRLDQVRAIVVNRDRDRIRLRGAKGIKTVFVEPQQVSPVLAHLNRYCHGASVKESCE